MAAKRFILTILAVAAGGIAAGFGASALFPAPDGATPADVIPPAGNGLGTGGVDPPAGRAMTEKDLPPELREAMEQDPQLAAEVRAGLASGEFVLDPVTAGAPNAGAGGRSGDPLTGKAMAFEGGTLRLDTPDGETSITVAPDTPVSLTTTAAEAGDALAEGSEVAVFARPNELGALTAESIIAGAAGPGLQPVFGGGATPITGTAAAFADGTLTVRTAGGDVAVVVADETPIQRETTAEAAADELTAGATVTAFVRRGEEGNFEAVSIVGGA